MLFLFHTRPLPLTRRSFWLFFFFKKKKPLKTLQVSLELMFIIFFQGASYFLFRNAQNVFFHQWARYVALESSHLLISVGSAHPIVHPWLQKVTLGPADHAEAHCGCQDLCFWLDKSLWRTTSTSSHSGPPELWSTVPCLDSNSSSTSLQWEYGGDTPSPA